MYEALQIPKSQAIALLVALGIKIAKKWDCKKLTERINAIEELPDEPFDSDELEEIADKLMEVDEAVVVPDEGDEEEPDDDEIEDDEEEPVKEKPKKKAKKEKAKPKTKAKPAKAKKEKKESIDSVTLELLKAKPMKLDTLVSAVIKKFPDNDPEALKRTTKRRLHGHLQAKFGVKIEQSDKGVYKVA